MKHVAPPALYRGHIVESGTGTRCVGGRHKRTKRDRTDSVLTDFDGREFEFIEPIIGTVHGFAYIKFTDGRSPKGPVAMTPKEVWADG